MNVLRTNVYKCGRGVNYKNRLHADDNHKNTVPVTYQLLLISEKVIHKQTNFMAFSPQVNYTELPPLTGEI
jgi:hypothetical protein